jgi:CBS domain containing-hemolysin-like protein
VVVATALEIVVVFVLAEAAPKTWAIQHPERAALTAAPIVATVLALPPVRVLTNGLIGLSNLLLPGRGLRRGPWVSEQELLAMADVAAEEDVIESEERALIRSIIEFGDTVVRAVMVPRPDMVAVAGTERVSQVIERAIEAGYSRIPVYASGVDDIVGVVYVKDLMRAARDGRGDQPVSELAREAHFVPETKRVAELMREMQKEKYHIAIAVDEYGGTAGLVTLEDLIEELVGEIVDEFDVEEPLMEPLPGGAFRVSARMAVGEVNELLHADLPAGDWDTVGGLVFNLLGHVPTEGESVEADGHRLVAEKVQGRRIGRVRIVPLPRGGSAGSDA